MEIDLKCGDCLELMNDIPDGSIDLILTDPPYGTTQCRWDSVIPFHTFVEYQGKKYSENEFRDIMTLKNVTDLTEYWEKNKKVGMWEQLERIIKPNGAIVLFCKQPYQSALIMSNSGKFKYSWVWNKHYCRGFLNAKKMPLRNTEEISVFYKKQCTYNPQMRKGKFRQKGDSAKQRGCYGKYTPVKTSNDVYYPTELLDFAGVPNSELLHPTQKPVDLLEYLILTYTNPGETVLDFTMGSGSTGVSAVKTGRNFIGIELDPGYFEIAEKRIKEKMSD